MALPESQRELPSRSDLLRPPMEPLPLRGFRLTIKGEWHACKSSNLQQDIRIELEGIWPLSLLKSAYSAEISGLVLVEGVTDWAPMTGHLSITPLPPGFELAVEFSDSRGERYIINYKTQSMNRFPFGKPTSAKGTLHKSAIKIGEVGLHVGLKLLLQALPSLA